MNLVAKEFVASRTDLAGVLVLSEFAGAAQELGDAVQCNPYDIDDIARAIVCALGMGEDEQRQRMRRMRRTVSQNTVHRWAADFINKMYCVPTLDLVPALQPEQVRVPRAGMHATLRTRNGSSCAHATHPTPRTTHTHTPTHTHR
jgi:trehalose 6-phosphate synthase/phosphatase